MSSQPLRRMFLGWVLAWAAGMAQAQQMDDEAAQLTEHVVGAVAYVSGGIGADERATLAARAGSYNLVLIFRLRNSSEALTDVGVRIATSKGDVLVDTQSEGPMLLARLPKGRYVVHAHYGDRTLKRAFVIGSARKQRAHKFILRWNASGG